MARLSPTPFFIGIGQDPSAILLQDSSIIYKQSYLSHEDLRMDRVMDSEHKNTVILIAGNEPAGRSFNTWLPDWRRALSDNVTLVGFSDDFRRRQVLLETGCDVVFDQTALNQGFFLDLTFLILSREWADEVDRAATAGITDGADITQRIRKSKELLELSDKWESHLPAFAEKFKQLADYIYNPELVY